MYRFIQAAVLFSLLLSGPAFAGLSEGRQAYLDKDWDKAILELRPLADGGDSEALFLLGNMYNDGNGVARDHRRAMELFKASASHDNPAAMVSIATMYATGLGVERSWKETVDWYGRAARLGSQAAQFFLALFLFQGDATAGVEPDKKAAYKWFRIASSGSEMTEVKDVSIKMAVKIAEELSTAEVLDVESEIKSEKIVPPPAAATAP